MTDHALAAGGDNDANTNANVAPPPITIPRQDEESGVEPFPSLDEASPQSPSSPISRIGAEGTTRSRGQSSTLSSIRRASKVFEESNPPTGFCIASGQIASQVPSITDIRRGSFGTEGWSGEGQVREKQRRTNSSLSTISQSGEQEKGRGKNPVGMNTPNNTSPGPELRHDVLPEAAEEEEHSRRPIEEDHNLKARSTVTHLDAKGDVLVKPISNARSSSDTSPLSHNAKAGDGYRTTPFDNGYQFPPKHSWSVSTAIFFKAFWKFFITPVGFLVTVYGLNVVAWGGMLFLLLCNASPAMCRPTCNDINSPRRIWIEIDSQILNALFCVTGFGTIPWRFRDLYYLLQYRIGKNDIGLRRLAGINRSWFRLPGSQDLPVELGPAQIVNGGANIPQSCVAFPLDKSPDAPLTGIRAPPTAMWKLDFVVWTMVWNTFLQAVLSGFMWGLNRYDRPSWSTGLFVALACIVAACGGIMSFMEAKNVKAIEGVPVSDVDREKLANDRELGIVHFNNIKDEKPKEKGEKKKEKEGKKSQGASKETRLEDSIEEGIVQAIK
nr:TPA_exp: alpha-L-rhamnosidase [Monilinia laxa]